MRFGVSIIRYNKRIHKNDKNPSPGEFNTKMKIQVRFCPRVLPPYMYIYICTRLVNKSTNAQGLGPLDPIAHGAPNKVLDQDSWQVYEGLNTSAFCIYTGLNVLADILVSHGVNHRIRVLSGPSDV